MRKKNVSINLSLHFIFTKLALQIFPTDDENDILIRRAEAQAAMSNYSKELEYVRVARESDS